MYADLDATSPQYQHTKTPSRKATADDYHPQHRTHPQRKHISCLNTAPPPLNTHLHSLAQGLLVLLALSQPPLQLRSIALALLEPRLQPLQKCLRLLLAAGRSSSSTSSLHATRTGSRPDVVGWVQVDAWQGAVQLLRNAASACRKSKSTSQVQQTYHCQPIPV
jgi:hypothetical protein